MNERIKELDIEAAHGTIDPNGPWTVEEFINYRTKFAELIVRECMNVVAKKCASPTAYNALVEHFGVEE